MPFALHTCGVTTGFTLHTDSYRTRLPHHYLTAHDPHALQEGRRLRSSRGRLGAASRDTTEKAPRRDYASLQASEVLTISDRHTTQQTSHSQIAQRLLPPTRRKSAAPPVTVPAPGQPPCARIPDRSHCRAVQNCQCCATTALFQPSNRQQTLPGLRLQRSLPGRVCCIHLPPVSSCTIIPCAAQPDAPPPLAHVVTPRLCRQWLTVRIKKAVLYGTAFHVSPLLPCGDLRSAQDVIRWQWTEHSRSAGAPCASTGTPV